MAAATATRDEREELIFVPAAPFRRYYQRLRLREGLSLGEVARRINADPECDTHWDPRRVKITLGLSEHRNGRSPKGRQRQRIRYETALLLCRAFGADPHELGV